MGVNVVSFFGGSSSAGFVDTQIGMPTDYGLITNISGNLVFVGSGTTETSKLLYDYECSMQSGVAAANYAWPTGVGCHPRNRHTVFGNGVTVFQYNPNAATGITIYGGGDKASSFGRGNV